MCKFTQKYISNNYDGIDIIKEGYMLDYILPHSDGNVDEIIDVIEVNTIKIQVIIE